MNSKRSFWNIKSLQGSMFVADAKCVDALARVAERRFPFWAMDPRTPTPTTKQPKSCRPSNSCSCACTSRDDSHKPQSPQLVYVIRSDPSATQGVVISYRSWHQRGHLYGLRRECLAIGVLLRVNSPDFLRRALLPLHSPYHGAVWAIPPAHSSCGFSSGLHLFDL